MSKKLRRGWRRLLGTFRRTRPEDEMHQELAAHIDMQTADNVRAGMPRDEARRAAVLKFGGVEAIKERYRDQRGLPRLEALLADLRYAARGLHKNPAFTLVMVATLALGIGANTAIFSLVSQVLLHPRGVTEPERVVVLQTRYDKLNLTGIGISSTTLADVRNSPEIFEHAAIMRGGDVNYTGGERPVHLSGAAVTADWFAVYGATPYLGRTFRPEDDQPGANRVAVLSYATWQSLFGGDEGVIGRKIELSQTQFEIVGVMRPEFRQPMQMTEVWAPLGLPASAFTEDNRFNENYFGVARARQGVSAVRASAWMDVLADRVRSAGTNHAAYAKDSQWGLFATPFADYMAGQTRSALLVLWAAVGLVLLIVCANAAGLMLARSSAHARELAVRAALGAGRARLMSQIFGECLLLGLAGGAAGIGLGYAGLHLLLKLAPQQAAAGLQSSLDTNVLLFTVAASVVTVLLFGAAPAWQTSRTDPQATLQRSVARASTAGRGRQRFRSALVVGETALALVLLIAAGTFLRGFSRIQAVDPGFDPQGVMSAYFALPRVQYAGGQAQANFYRATLEQLRSAPGVLTAGIGGPLPFSGESAAASFTIEGRDPAPGDPGPHGNIRFITPGYLEALGIPLKRGRLFTDADRYGAQRVAIIDENLARQYWPDEDPIGKRIRSGEWYTVIGIVGHILDADLAADTGKGTYYFTMFQRPSPVGMIVARTTGDPAALSSAIRDAVLAADPAQPVYNLRSIESYIDASLGPRRFVIRLLGFFALAALLLAALGLYGVISYAVTQRTREIGIRVALGAGRGSVLRLIVGQGLLLGGIGVAIGAAGAIASGPLIKSQLFEVSAFEPATIAATAATLLGAALLASYLPARRAARVDPAMTLREE